MDKTIRITKNRTAFVIVSIIFLLLFVTYYFVTIRFALSTDAIFSRIVMHINFFLCEVVFISASIFIVFRYFRLFKNNVLVTLYAIIASLLVSTYILSYFQIAFFPVVGSILIYVGLVLSGSIVLLFDNKLIKAKEREL